MPPEFPPNTFEYYNISERISEKKLEPLSSEILQLEDFLNKLNIKFRLKNPLKGCAVDQLQYILYIARNNTNIHHQTYIINQLPNSI